MRPVGLIRPIRHIYLFIWLLVLAAPCALAQAPADPPRRPPGERILTMRRLLTADRQELARLTTLQQEADQAFDRSLAAIDALEARLTEARRRQTESSTPDATKPEHHALEDQTANARQDFNAIVDKQAALRGRFQTLQDKIALEQQLYDQWSQGKPTSGITTAPPPLTPSTSADKAASKPDAKPDPKADTKPTRPAIGNARDADDDDRSSRDSDLVEAEKDEADAQAAVEKAQASVQRLSNSIAIFEKDLASAATVQVAVEKDLAAMRVVLAAPEQRTPSPADLAARADLEARAEQSSKDIALQRDRVAESEATLATLKTLKEAAEQRVEKARAEARTAHTRVTFYKSPIAPTRIADWLQHRGPRVLFVLFGMTAFYWVARLFGQRLVTFIVSRGHLGTELDRKERAETLRRVFISGSTIAIVLLGTLTALNQAGIDVTVLLGGAAVLGAAFAFGSQNLVQDYFSGFMILVENQYRVGNVIRVGNLTGTVEDITLRITVVRDLDGTVYFIRHSQILQLSNLTYGYSRLVFSIKIAPDQDVDRAMAVMMETAATLQHDPAFAEGIVGDPEMLGVDEFAASGTEIKFLLKTKPLQRWKVKREMLRRLKIATLNGGIKIA